MCGWLKDPYGLSWQVTPKRLYELLSDPNPARAAAAQKTMLLPAPHRVSELEAAAGRAS